MQSPKLALHSSLDAFVKMCSVQKDGKVGNKAHCFCLATTLDGVTLELEYSFAGTLENASDFSRAIK